MVGLTGLRDPKSSSFGAVDPRSLHIDKQRPSGFSSRDPRQSDDRRRRKGGFKVGVSLRVGHKCVLCKVIFGCALIAKLYALQEHKIDGLDEECQIEVRCGWQQICVVYTHQGHKYLSVIDLSSDGIHNTRYYFLVPFAGLLGLQ